MIALKDDMMNALSFFWSCVDEEQIFHLFLVHFWTSPTPEEIIYDGFADKSYSSRSIM